MNMKTLKVADVVAIENSLTTILVKYKNDPNKFGILYHDPENARLVQLFSHEFARAFKELVSDFGAGHAAGAIVGRVRARTPADEWFSDTIERSSHDTNSLYKGIVRIIDQEDGIPVFIPSTSTIGNITPALGHFLKGNRLKIKKILAKYNYIQQSIMLKIQEGKPKDSLNNITAFYCAGEGFKSENRLKTISGRLDMLTFAKNGSCHTFP